jgi:hypothetical protein
MDLCIRNCTNHVSVALRYDAYHMPLLERVVFNTNSSFDLKNAYNLI